MKSWKSSGWLLVCIVTLGMSGVAVYHGNWSQAAFFILLFIYFSEGSAVLSRIESDDPYRPMATRRYNCPRCEAQAAARERCPSCGRRHAPGMCTGVTGDRRS